MVSNQIERAWTNSHGSAERDNAVKLGLRWLGDVCSRLGDDEALLVIPAYKHAGFLTQIISESALKNRRFNLLPAGVNVTIASAQALPPYFAGPALALFMDVKGVERIETLGVNAICAVQWVRGALEPWVKTWNPVDLISGSRSEQPSRIGNAVVEEAMKTLTSLVNTSTGLSHSSDEEAARSIFHVLRTNGEDFDPDEIRSWARAHGWTPGGADEVAQVAAAAKAGRKRPTRQMVRPDVINSWRERAAEQ